MNIKIKLIILLATSSLIILCSNIAHNSSSASVGAVFSISHEKSNKYLTENYFEIIDELSIKEVIYFKPIWHWSFIFHSKMIVTMKDESVHYFSGEFWGPKSPIYAKIKIEEDKLLFYRLGGFNIKDTKGEQLILGKEILTRLVLNISIKNKIEYN
jgi:hypothetical protein